MTSLGDGRFLLFSGAPSATNDATLWELQVSIDEAGVASAGWTAIEPAPGADWPEARYGHHLVTLPAALCLHYVSNDECVLLWGGRERGRAPEGIDGTWIWSRTGGFVRLPSSLEPPTRVYAATARDEAGGRAVLFGGWSCSPPTASGSCPYAPLADTWVFDELGWRELVLDPSPPRRSRATLTDAPAGGRLLLLGGRSGARSDPVSDLEPIWELLGDRWWQLGLPYRLPEPRQAAAAFVAPDAEALVFHGGLGVTATNQEGDPLGDSLALPLAPESSFADLRAGLEAPYGFRAWAFDPALGLVLFGGSDADDVESFCRLDLLRIR